MRNDLNITVTSQTHSLDYSLEVNLTEVNSKDDILDLINDDLKSNVYTSEEEQDNFEECTDFRVIDWQDVPDNCQDIETAIELAKYYGNSYYDIDVFEAANDVGIDFRQVDEAYSGYWGNDEEFAQDMAESLGAIDKNAQWPNTCIDWDQAAHELMFDYSQANGHYFRNF